MYPYGEQSLEMGQVNNLVTYLLVYEHFDTLVMTCGHTNLDYMT